MVLELNQILKKYRQPVLSDLSLSIAAGESVALVGANGAGKSTLLKIILGLVQPSAGSVKLMGHDPRDPRGRARVGYLPELPAFWPELSAREYLRWASGLRHLAADRADELLIQVGLTRRGDRPMGEYSKGMLQRVGVAHALLADPAMLILDEPMSGLDPRAQEKMRAILERLRGEKKTLLISSHAVEDIRRLCTRVVVLERGRLVDDGPTEKVLARVLARYQSAEPWDEDEAAEVRS